MSIREQSVSLVPPARTKLSPNGRIVIPAAIREALNLKAGEMLHLEVADGVLRIESFDRKLRAFQDELIRLVGPDRSLADELIAERREEARREQQELNEERSVESESYKRAS
jgi:AbrB family looped-hinge helix DNA binding protein